MGFVFSILCACVLEGFFHYRLTCFIQISNDPLKATVTINLGMIRKLVVVGYVLSNVFRTEVKNVHSGDQKWSDWSCFQIICCCEHNAAQTGLFTQTAVDECVVSCRPGGC